MLVTAAMSDVRTRSMADPARLVGMSLHRRQRNSGLATSVVAAAAVAAAVVAVLVAAATMAPAATASATAAAAAAVRATATAMATAAALVVAAAAAAGATAPAVTVAAHGVRMAGPLALVVVAAAAAAMMMRRRCPMRSGSGCGNGLGGDLSCGGSGDGPWLRVMSSGRWCWVSVVTGDGCCR